MMFLLGLLGKLLGSVPGIADGILSYLAKKQDAKVLTNGQNVTADVTVNQAVLTAYVEERKVMAAERAKLSESRWTAWMIPTAFGFAVFHFGMIVLDSTFRFGWAIAKLPPPYDQLQWTIITAVIGVSGAGNLVKRIFK